MTVQDLLNAAQQLSPADQLRLAEELKQIAESKLQKSAADSVVNAEPKRQEDDPIVGLFDGSPDLSAKAKDILSAEVTKDSGFTWKES